MTTLFMHHYYIPKVDYGHTYITNFHEEFDNADHVGTEAILETYNRLFEEWKIMLEQKQFWKLITDCLRNGNQTRRISENLCSF